MFSNSFLKAKSKSLYDILGILPDSSLITIKRAYRKLAMKHHPDKKDGNVELFREITSAYEVLSDPEKKRLYDQEGDPTTNHPIFDHFFHSMFTRTSSGTMVVPPPIQKEITITLEEAYHGCRTQIIFSRSSFCIPCNGQGGTNITKCLDCHGLGIRLVLEKIGHAAIRQNKKTCNTCVGTGTHIHTNCIYCHGKKTKVDSDRVSMYIQPVIAEKGVILLKGRGDCGKSGEKGDVRVVVNIQPHEIFHRVDDDLHMTRTICLSEALLGYTGTVQHLSGQWIDISTTTCLSPGMVIQHRGHGMTTIGSLFVTFKILFPTQLSTEQQSVLRTVFPSSENNNEIK
jgi:DnaJ family protein A protein 2